jgi:hypothetical protein
MAHPALGSSTIQGDVMTNRSTHAYDGPLALFLIGVRIHQPWRLRVVSQVIRAMPPMIAELERNKAAAATGEEESLGYLGSRSTVDLTGTTMIQWWRSTEDIYAYASSTDHHHRESWLEFYRRAKDAPSALTIWHETYAVQPGGVESLYATERPFGLGTVAGVVPVGRRGESAHERIGSTVA